MTMTDPIADMLARIRNGQMAQKSSIEVPASKVKRAIAAVLKEQGFVADVQDVVDAKFPTLEITLKYVAGEPAIKEMKRFSRPGLRQYKGAEEVPFVRNGLGVAIVTTSKGVMTDADARAQKIGGEVLCTVF